MLFWYNIEASWCSGVREWLAIADDNEASTATSLAVPGLEPIVFDEKFTCNLVEGNDEPNSLFCWSKLLAGDDEASASAAADLTASFTDDCDSAVSLGP